MSVEHKLIRLSARAFARLRRRPAALPDLIEDHYELSYFDTRINWQHAIDIDRAPPCMVHVDEFTLWLLTERDPYSALCDAVTGERAARELKSAPHGQGFAYATYYPPRAVRSIARGLDAYSTRKLQERFFLYAGQFRQAATGRFIDDAAILAYQQAMLHLLRAFYRQASHDHEYILQLIV